MRLNNCIWQSYQYYSSDHFHAPNLLADLNVNFVAQYYFINQGIIEYIWKSDVSKLKFVKTFIAKWNMNHKHHETFYSTFSLIIP